MISELASLQAFGPAAIFLGSGLEGQTVAIAGGVMARMGMMHWQWALASACAGTAVMDQILFFLGRYGRSTRLVKRMAGKPAVARAMGFVESNPFAFVMSFRFVFGLRAAGPVVAGLSAMGIGVYTALNLAAAALWAALFTGGGFVFGETLQHWLEHPTLKSNLIAGALGLTVAAAFAVLTLRRARALPAVAASS